MRPWALVAVALLVALLPAAAAARATGTLAINSTTNGAEVYVDGQLVGRIPLEQPVRLPVGQHTLKMVLEGYTEFLDVFTIRRGQPTTLDIDLLPYAGVLRITANVKKARVFIDGKYEGSTPLTKEVLVGKRAVRVRKAGYYEFLAQVEALAGQTKRLRVELKPMPVGTTPYRPAPPPPPKWYEKWYVWAGAAAAVAAVTTAIVVPVVLATRDEFGELCSSADKCWHVTPK